MHAILLLSLLAAVTVATIVLTTLLVASHASTYAFQCRLCSLMRHASHSHVALCHRLPRRDGHIAIATVWQHMRSALLAGQACKLLLSDMMCCHTSPDCYAVWLSVYNDFKCLDSSHQCSCIHPCRYTVCCVHDHVYAQAAGG